LGNLAETLKLNTHELFPISVTSKGEISGRITDVIDDLNSRCQMNVKNIYVSPIIQNFNLAGTVYVKALHDKESLKTKINNNIYIWLDLNADFGVSLRKSNIVKIIETEVGVIKTDVDILPDDITMGVNNKTNKYFFGANDPILSKYGNSMINLFGLELTKYLSKSSYEKIDELRKFYNRFIFSINFFNVVINLPIDNTTTLTEKKLDLNNYITERSFYNDLVKNLYSVLITNAEKQPMAKDYNTQNDYTYLDKNDKIIINYRRFIGYNVSNTNYNSFNRYFSLDATSDFAKVIEKIHKDLSYIIRYNMLDSYGNIEEEYDNNGKFIRGGYSLGSEIVKLNLSSLNCFLVSFMNSELQGLNKSTTSFIFYYMYFFFIKIKDIFFINKTIYIKV
jgi:hypothetical protein